MSDVETSQPAGRWARWRRGAGVPWRVLTPLGRGVLLLGVVSTGLAARLHWQEFQQAAGTALALLLLGVLWQLLPGVPSAALTLRSDRIVEGAPAPAAVLEVHTGAVPLLFPTVVVPVGEHDDVRVRLPLLRPFAHHTEELLLPDLPRGVHVVGPVSYTRTDPVGLLSRRFTAGAPRTLLVSPRVVDVPAFASGLTNDLDGSASQQLSMSDLAFHALREYVPGDDLRHVHWRSSAKAGELLVRQFHETRRGHVTVLLDASAEAYRGADDFELAVSVATSVALRAVRDELDLYLRSGSHVAHTRDAVAVTDLACRFATEPVDHYLEQAAAAAAESRRTGLVVQVTGAGRDLVHLDAAASRFGRQVEWLAVRADTAGEGRAREGRTLRGYDVAALAQLPDLLARGRG